MRQPQTEAPVGSDAAAPKRVRNGADTKARIEREALRLFALKGVDGATIRDLAIAVGVADAALYRYYASKEEIAADIFRRHYSALAFEIRGVRERERPFAETVRELVHLFCVLFDEQPDVFAFILLNQHAHLRFVDPHANVVAEVALIMARAFEAREMAIANCDLAAAISLGIVLQPAIFKLYGRLPGPLQLQETDMTRAVISSLGACGN